MLVRSRFLALSRRLLSQAAATTTTASPATTNASPSWIDIQSIKSDVEKWDRNAKLRLADVDVKKVVDLHSRWTQAKVRIDELRHKQKEAAAAKDIALGKQLKAELQAETPKLAEHLAAYLAEAVKIPNMSSSHSPEGSEPRLIRNIGEKRAFDFEPRHHLDVAKPLGLIDFERAGKVSGQKFYYLNNAAALLELGLVNWAVTKAARRGFTAVTTPDLVRSSVAEACGFQPRGEHTQIYHVANSDMVLIGTAEIPLGGRFSDTILSETDLPIKMVGFSHCFRTEAGALGLATRGLYRVHQFSKVELFAISTAAQSEAVFNELLSLETELFSELEIHCRVLEMPTEDLGAPAHRKIDIEAWMPGRGDYGEISSLSSCTEFQSRRLGLRYREKPDSPIMFPHTLNATACAIPRILIALLETHQQADGHVVIPKAIRPFVGGMEIIEPVVNAHLWSSN